MEVPSTGLHGIVPQKIELFITTALVKAKVKVIPITDREGP
jgi:hypothetical protein